MIPMACKIEQRWRFTFRRDPAIEHPARHAAALDRVAMPDASAPRRRTPDSAAIAHAEALVLMEEVCTSHQRVSTSILVYF